MSKDNFSWKSLFVNEDNDSNSKKPEQNTSNINATQNKFPTEVDNSKANNSVNNPFLNEILDVYEKGFDSLNLSDFDFFELYKSVIAVGASNPQSYHMAFTMGKTIKNDLTKEFLVEKSKFYVAEIEKVHTNFHTKGNTRKHDLEITITRDKVNLTKEISDIESKMIDLQKQLDQKKMELSKIDSNNSEQFDEIQMKIEANNFAKDKLLNSINLVVSGINQYL